MKPRIIALLGSPLIGGTTAKLLDEAIRGAEDAGCTVEKIVVPFLNFNPCMELFFCVSNETCRMKDDITPIYEKIREIDGIIVASPIMTMGIPGKLKAFIDRFQVYFMAKYVRKKPLVPAEKRNKRRGLYLAISGMNLPTVFDGAKMTIKAFFEIIDVTYGDELLIRDMDTIRDITTRPACLAEAYRKGKELGKSLVSLQNA